MTPRDDDPELSTLLASLRQDPPDDGFNARLHRRLAAAGPPDAPRSGARLLGFMRERPWLVGVVCGSVAGVAAFALSAALLAPAQTRVAAAPPDAPAAGGAALAAKAPREPAAGTAGVQCPALEPAAVATSAEVFVVPAGKVALVQLQFSVDRDVDQAEFSVLLPEGLSFFSEGETLPDRAIHWVAPLSRGDNRVPIAVISQQPGRHRLAATATIAGEVVVHEIVLDVKESA